MKTAICHPDRKHHAKGLCQSCYTMQYNAAHKEERNAKSRQWHVDNLERAHENRRRWRQNNREKTRALVRKSYQKHREDRREVARSTAKKQRNQVLQHYGGSCFCCGEKTTEFLAIDHIDGGGTKHRSQLGGSSAGLVRWLIKNEFPRGFRVLCHNCNSAIGFYGYCPHQREIENV